MADAICVADECVEPIWIKKRSLCRTHYRRWYNHGDVNWKPPDPIPCLGCAAQFVPRHGAQKFCTVKCFTRAASRRNKRKLACSVCGQPMWIGPGVLPQGEGTCRKCRASGAVVRDYQSAHARVKRQHGPARNHACDHCGKPALDWAYDHKDPNELTGLTDRGSTCAYSLDPAHYIPLCRSCHYKFDEPHREFEPPDLFKKPILEWSDDELSQGYAVLGRYIQLRRRQAA